MDNARLRSHKLTNVVHSMLLLGGMALLLGTLGWTIAGPEGVLWTFLLGAVLLALSPRVTPHVLLKLYHAQRLTRRIAPGLHALLEELARRAGLDSLPQLYYVPSRVLNAFTLGRGEETAIAVTDGLLRNLSPRELAGVLAHELSHVRNDDTWVMGLADLVSRLTASLSFVGMLLLILNLPLLVFTGASFSLLPVALLVLAPTLSALLQMALSRTREYDADLDAAATTGDPRGLAAALDKLERYQGGWVERLLLPGRRVPDPSLLRTHPPTAERVRRLLKLAPRRAALGVPLELEDWETRDGRDLPRIVRPPRWHVHGLWH
jgi:heat shock protein HtpX